MTLRMIKWKVQKKLKSSASEIQKQLSLTIALFLGWYEICGQTEYNMGNIFALSSNFVSGWDQVPGIWVKTGQEVFAIFDFSFCLAISAFLAFSDTCILFYAKSWT